MKSTNIDVDSQLYKFSSENLPRQSLQFPIQLRVMTKEETKEYHLKKLYELSIKSLGEIPQLTEPKNEQKVWVIGKIKANTWEVWDT